MFQTEPDPATKEQLVRIETTLDKILREIRDLKAAAAKTDK